MSSINNSNERHANRDLLNSVNLQIDRGYLISDLKFNMLNRYLCPYDLTELPFQHLTEARIHLTSYSRPRNRDMIYRILSSEQHCGKSTSYNRGRLNRTTTSSIAAAIFVTYF